MKSFYEIQFKDLYKVVGGKVALRNRVKECSSIKDVEKMVISIHQEAINEKLRVYREVSEIQVDRLYDFADSIYYN
jgi:hypothetical protein